MKQGRDNTWPNALYMISAIVFNMLPMYVNVLIDVCERTFFHVKRSMRVRERRLRDRIAVNVCLS